VRAFGRRLRSMWRALRRSKELDADMQDEMRFHIQMEAERLGQAGDLGSQEARRRAHVRFGGVERYKEEGREARGFGWLDTLSLDARLGVRMLAGSLLSVVVFAAAGVGAAPASVLLVAVAALMMGVASLAALGPARRTLRVPTVDALRFDG
jgi:hypothetical protein